MRVVASLFRLLWDGFVLLTPVLGVWAASSLAAYFGGPLWAALAAGAMLFPVLPVAWEGSATIRVRRKHSKKQREGAPKRWLRRSDRLVLRTLTINLLFLGGLVLYFPMALFPALSTRGDWFLDDMKDARAEDARRVVFAAAEQVEFLYRLTNQNPYENLGPEGGEDDGPAPKPNPKPTPSPSPSPSPNPSPSPTPATDRDWPFGEELHPLVAQVPEEAEGSIHALGVWVKQQVPDKLERVRVLHDWVADRVAYDYPSLSDGSYPTKQSAKQVFASRTGVCAGYANLMVALGEVTGDELRYISGHARDMDGSVDGAGHAWNAVKLDDGWHLLDVTWNSGRKRGQKDDPFKTTYFLTPPDVFGYDHFPRDEAWQLRAQPLTRGAWLRQPLLAPSFFAEGFRLVQPDRTPVEADGKVRIVIDNRARRHVVASALPKGTDGQGDRCEVSQGARVTIDCDLGGSGLWGVRLFSNDQPTGVHWMVGVIEASNRR